MKYHTSKLKSFGSESMSDCTPHVTDIRASESFPQNSSKSKVSVENVASDYGLGDLWRLVAGNPEQDEIVNARLRPGTSEKHLHLEHHRLA